MFFSSIKEIDRLISKVMSNIYLKVTMKNWRSQNFDCLSLKNLSLGQFWESLLVKLNCILREYKFKMAGIPAKDGKS